jgi:hypothetical protein
MVIFHSYVSLPEGNQAIEHHHVSSSIKYKTDIVNGYVKLHTWGYFCIMVRKWQIYQQGIGTLRQSSI